MGKLWIPFIVLLVAMADQVCGEDKAKKESIEAFAVGRDIYRVSYGAGLMKIEKQPAGSASYVDAGAIKLDLKDKEVTSVKGGAWMETGMVLGLRVKDLTSKHIRYYWATSMGGPKHYWALSEINLAKAGDG